MARRDALQLELDELETLLETETEKRPPVMAEAEALAAGRPLESSPACTINVPETRRRFEVVEKAVALVGRSLHEQEHQRACNEIRRLHLPAQHEAMADFTALVPALAAAFTRIYRFNQKFDRIDHPPAFRIFDVFDQNGLSRLIQQLNAWPEPLESHDDNWRPQTE